MRVALPLPRVKPLGYLAVSNQGSILHQQNVNDPLETIREISTNPRNRSNCNQPIDYCHAESKIARRLHRDWYPMKLSWI